MLFSLSSFGGEGRGEEADLSCTAAVHGEASPIQGPRIANHEPPCSSPSPLNGERAGVRGETVRFGCQTLSCPRFVAKLRPFSRFQRNSGLVRRPFDRVARVTS